MQSGQLLIDGKWVNGAGSVFNSLNPADNKIIWRGGAASQDQISEALACARRAFTNWSDLAVEQRIEIAEQFTNHLGQHKAQLSEIISQETGKPRWEAATEVAAMIGKVGISISAYHQRSGLVRNQIATGTQALRHRPHGVLAVYGPYNFPGHLPNGHIVPALIAGNTLIFKPSELTPYTAEFMVKLWQDAGLPGGVLNLIQGEIETGRALASEQQIDGLLFTGSAQTGKILHQQFAGKPEKILALEMGGNNPLIVHSINDIKALVYTIIQSAFITSGQRCTCARRLYIPAGNRGDALVRQLVETTAKLKVGPQTQIPEPFMGPVISQKVASGMRAAYLTLIKSGGQSLLELKHLDVATGLVSPGIIDVSEINSLPDEEFFGPLLQIIRFDDFDDAIDQANNTRFGLAAGLLGGDEADYQHFLKKIRAGIVNWNHQTTGASSAAPFGGIGASGNHRPSAYYAADYCAYPVASLESPQLKMPEKLAPGVAL